MGGGTVAAILDEARARPGGLVTEVAAKRLLEACGVATTLGSLARSADEAVDLAERAGLPVVLKVASPSVLHKTDVGGVRVDLRTPEAVAAAYGEIVRALEPLLGTGWDTAGVEGQGVLVEPMARGFEFLVGATRSEFGPLLVFGLGGVFAEVLEDVAHGLAPVDEVRARRMLRAIKGRAVFDAFRGAEAVSEDAVAGLLTKVSALVSERPEIAELDLNPVMCSGAQVLVADARMVVAEPDPVPPARPGPDDALPRLLAPRSVAVVGATTGRYNRARAWLRSVKAAGFAGPAYAVSRKDQVDDFPTVRSLDELPETPDLVMVEVGRQAAQAVLEDCARIGVPWASVHTSGFGEDGTAEGQEAGAWLQEFLARGGTRVVGPSALGPYSPAHQLVPGGLPTRPGTVGLLSQSGVAFTTVARTGAARGFGISHGVSYGTEADVGVHDYLRFLAADAGTELIACYLEGVQRPREFAEALRAAAARKPVLLVKGGRSDLGARAAQSHSGALTAPSTAWEALCAQAGAFLLDDVEALLDGIAAFTYLRRLDGLGAAVVTPSGGWGVLFADHCARAGMALPELAGSTRARVEGTLPPGTSVRNPIDIGNGYFDVDAVGRLLVAMGRDEAVDVVCFHLAMDVFTTTLRHAPWMEAAYVEMLAGARAAMAPTPLAVVAPHTVDDARREALALALLDAGIPVFAQVDRALAAWRDVHAWTRRHAPTETPNRQEAAR